LVLSFVKKVGTIGFSYTVWVLWEHEALGIC